MTNQDIEATREKVLCSLKTIRAKNPLLAKKILGVKAKDFIRTFSRAPLNEPKTVQAIMTLVHLLGIHTPEIEEEAL